jgi:hypothetical protein
MEAMAGFWGDEELMDLEVGDWVAGSLSEAWQRFCGRRL